MYKENDVIRLIDKLYKDLYLSDDVFRRESDNKYDKFGNIKRYLDRLERVHDSVRDTGRHKDMLKKMYYDRYVIKREDIPESYYNHQQEIALERGYGHVEITDDMKRQYQDDIINNQKASLDIWLDYFLSEDARDYSFWAKYWAFQGMLRLGNYDKEKGEFGRRTKATVSPFVDLNREALAISIDLIIKLLNKEEIEDKELDVLVKSGSFQKIYAYVITHVLKDNKNIIKKNNGVWVKYNQGTDHMVLVKSLQGYNTGWCTAGEATAKSQLANGDFYVYYTLDENDEYKVPRIAIRMEYGRIAEIRGVASDQNIESDMECVVEEKLKEFPDREEYYKKVNDMKKLTKIYKKYKNNEELTKDELRFLYEIDGKITGFGYQKDPRIREIIRERNSCISDLAFIFDCREDQIAFHKFDINKDTVYCHSDLDFSYCYTIDGIILPKFVGGNLDLSFLKRAEGLELPQSIGGDLNLRSLTSAEGLVLPESIGGTLNLSGLTSTEGLELPQSIGCSLDLGGLTSAEGLELPQTLGGYLDLSGLTIAEDLELPQSIGGDLYLNDLINANGLIMPQSIGGNLDLRSLTSADGLVLPQSIGGSLELGSLTKINGLKFPRYIGYDLILKSLTTAEGVKLPENVGNFLDLSGLKNAKGLVLPENIRGSLNLSELTNAKGISFPRNIGGYLCLSGLKTAEDLKLPDSIGGDLDLCGLRSSECLKLPQSIVGDLYLCSLTSSEGLELPQSIGGDLDLSGLTSASGLVLPQNIIGGLCALVSLDDVNGLIIPEPLMYAIHFSRFVITSENVDEYVTKKKR